MLHEILKEFGLSPLNYRLRKYGTGLINRTWKVSDFKNDQRFILQQINKNVFKSPRDIAGNINRISKYLSNHHPEYLFVPHLPSTKGDFIVTHKDEYYRLSPFVANSVTLDAVGTPNEAYEAARQFAKFTHLLADFNSSELNYTLLHFHDLTFRFAQFKEATKSASAERKAKAKGPIADALRHKNIAQTYDSIVNDKLIPYRVIHHDTKISNVLFNRQHKGLCVIDLDTVMPGHYISDIGDMVRTYLSPCNEEERDFSKIEIRPAFFSAIVEGYFLEMGTVLTQSEKEFFVYSGKFMIYMQALRFLTDYLSNDVYYNVNYPTHNLLRAQNQFVLLYKYLEAENILSHIVKHYNTSIPI
jgi:Ser/Thr protein kinase RdoA (MazF antagonist)